jgi:SAM-dependent methyltransferase
MDPIVSALERALRGAQSVLDVGCGNNSPLGRFRRRLPFSTGVDAFAPWIAESREKGIHDEYVEMDIRRIGERFDAASFDAVICCDVLEHLEKGEGESLLAQMEALARSRVVVLTPNGFLPQEATWGNPYQVHRAGWTASDLRERGYRVSGLGGLATLRGERGTIRWRPARFWSVISRLTDPIVRLRPEAGFHLLAVKDRAS